METENRITTALLGWQRRDFCPGITGVAAPTTLGRGYRQLLELVLCSEEAWTGLHKDERAQRVRSR